MSKDHHGSSMPLQMASVSQVVKLAQIRGGKEMQHRLAEMGLISGVEMKIIERGQSGPFIVEVKGSRLVLGKGMVPRIFVVPIED